MTTLKVSIPATTANLGPGFDCLGMALGLWNDVLFTPQETGISIEVIGEGAGQIPTDCGNLIVKAMAHLCAFVDRPLPDCYIKQVNRVPVASGMGSSATAIVAGLVGVNELLGGLVDQSRILAMATQMEGHPDNVAAALLGGLVLVPPNNNGQLFVERIELPAHKVVVTLPDFDLLTSEARAVLPAQYSREDTIYNLARVPLVMRGLEQDDYGKLAIAIQDRLHQPYRIPLVPGTAAAFEASLAVGAAAVAISGAGPGIIAFASDHHDTIAQAMQEAYKAAGIQSRTWCLDISNDGVICCPLPQNDRADD